MAVDKLVDSTQLDADLTSVANAIRTKGGTSAQMAFPVGFIDAIGDIQTGDGYSKNDIGMTTYSVSGDPWGRGHLSGEWEISGKGVPEWALSHTAITKAKITIQNGDGVSGYIMGDRAFSRNLVLEDVYLKILEHSGGYYLTNYYIFQGCTKLERVCIDGVIAGMNNNTFNGCPLLTDIYVSWSEGDVANAPWSATNATVHYNSTFDSDGNPIV